MLMQGMKGAFQHAQEGMHFRRCPCDPVGFPICSSRKLPHSGSLNHRKCQKGASMNLSVLIEDVSVLSSFCLMVRCFGYLALALVMTSKSQQLLVLPGHEVDGGVFQQSGEDEEEAHRHPDVYSLHIGDLNTQTHTSGKCTHFSAISKSLTKKNHIYYI